MSPWPPCTGAKPPPATLPGRVGRRRPARGDVRLPAARRRSPASRSLARLGAARAAVPDLAVTTDLIVGFPGETDDDFERPLGAGAAAGNDRAHTSLSPARP